MTVVLCDMDGIIANLHEKLLRRLNKKHGANWTVGDITQWRVEDALGLPDDEAWNIISEDGFFEDLNPIPGALKGLQQLQDAGLEVVILTTPTLNPSAFSEKKRWADKYMPFIKHKHFMLGELKHMVKADIFIDDSPTQQKNYMEAWPESKVYTIEYPFVPHPGVFAAASFKDMASAWEIMAESIIQQSRLISK